MKRCDRALSPKVRLGAAVAIGLSAGLSWTDKEAEAQEAKTEPAATDTNIKLPAVRVKGETKGPAEIPNTNATVLDIGRMPTSVRDTPQVINVVPQEIIKQQRLYTLDQALANVPGITLSTGEGRGGLNGDQFRIRGQQARGDIYTDGLKDFGTYTRDIFDIENVEVIKGPAGEYFGAANLGGLINESLKKAHEGTSYNYDQAFGSASMYRGQGDVNYQFNKDVALRINGMYNRAGVADRDYVYSNRYGASADLGVGLRSNTSWHLNWRWLHTDSMPDYGVGMIKMANGTYRPMTSEGLARNTTYARSEDRDNSDIHSLRSSLKSKISSWFTLSNNTRLTKYERNYAATTPAACSTAACVSQFMAGGNPALSYGAGGGAAYLSKGWGAENVLMGAARFTTWNMKHDLKFGVDVNYQDENRYVGTWYGRVNNQTIRNASHSANGAYLRFPKANMANSDQRDVGLFLSDHIQLTKELALFGSVRWDAFQSTFAGYQLSATPVPRQKQNADRWSPSGSIMYTPLKNSSFYFTFSRSYKPIGTDVSSQVTILPSDTPQNGADFKPQRSDLFEFGNKTDFLHKRLGLGVAFFQINQNNSYYYDENGDVVTGFSDSGVGLRTRGVELNLTGKITKNWDIYGAYSWMDGKIRNNATYRGKEAPGVSHNNFSVWTSYDLTDHLFRPETGHLKIAGGAQYASGYWANGDFSNTARIPYQFSLNGMISWEAQHYRISFNANNITNHLNYASSFSTSRAVPGPGRSFIGNVGLTF
ncbi:outer membrane siderophore receptor [Acetobacter tropicalis NBRC 101654]|uniref:Outer membrane siderophore receptor n=1 Tax=Acetobacter tropicalis NBRC 101654 TaxID=749388 RepID=F7VF57_9PROT|nr:TonB-dependent receptor [Acetobacter tropicalis]GAA09002.1 outer membrane siderophore receptor [Acetobacter tropicalis NBRC 101654]